MGVCLQVVMDHTGKVLHRVPQLGELVQPYGQDWSCIGKKFWDLLGQRVVWHPRSTALACHQPHGHCGSPQVYIHQLDHTSGNTIATELVGEGMPISWSPDGRLLRTSTPRT